MYEKCDYFKKLFTIECCRGFAEVAVEKTKEGTDPYTARKSKLWIHISI